MKTYMATYRKQNCLAGEWNDCQNEQNSLFIFAENNAEAQIRLDTALRKLNEYAMETVRYVKEMDPRPIIAMSVSHNTACGTTSFTGLWD